MLLKRHPGDLEKVLQCQQDSNLEKGKASRRLNLLLSVFFLIFIALLPCLAFTRVSYVRWLISLVGDVLCFNVFLIVLFGCAWFGVFGIVFHLIFGVCRRFQWRVLFSC